MNAPSPGAAQQTVAGWFADPYGRFGYRWHDGQVWTDAVATNGVQSVDRAVPAPPAQLAPPGLSAPPAPGPPTYTAAHWPPQAHSPAPALGPAQWQPQLGLQPQPGSPAGPPPQKGSSALVKVLVAVVGVLVVGGAVVAVASPSAENDDMEQPAPDQPVDTRPLADAVAEFSTQFAWDQVSPQDRADSCLAWELSPEFAREAFLSGAGPENEALWAPMEAILRAEC